MKKRVKSKALFLVIFADIFLVAAAMFLMNYVQYLLNEDVRVNLTEIVTQNKNVIDSKLSMELNNLELEAKQLAKVFAEANDYSYAATKKQFLDYTTKEDKSALIWAASDGNAVDGNGQEVNIAGRPYFKLGMNGGRTISDRLVSRINGEDIFVLCVPVNVKNKVIGTIQKQYSPQQMYDLCSVSLFAEQGSTYIINSQGYILICSETSEYNRESDNYFRIMYMTDPAASVQLEADVKHDKSGFMEAVIEGKKVFFAYTPIEQIHDWYLISSIPTATVSSNANVVVRLFYCVLFAVTLLFTFSMLYYFSLKRKQQTDLERIAFVDTVTAGDSYTKLLVDMQDILRDNSQKSFYICTFDIDNFKYINSYYGFEIGDKILKEIYAKYKSRLLANERIARINGDRFVMLLEDVSRVRLDQLMDLEFSFDDIKVYLSTGIYGITNINESVNLMVDKARVAAHHTKGKHFKEVQFYSEAFEQETVHNEQMKRAIEIALANKDIIPFFQPKVNILTKELVGAEALARWQTKDGKLVSPGEFIPVCEQTGLISLVDMTIFEQTLAFIRSNLEQGVHCVPISVNFSRLHLLNGDFVKMIFSKLSEYQVPPDLIELELTETVIFDNHQTINDFIQDLHSYGFKISMDDFGSGYSSLHMLKDVEIDVLKIDRGFLLDTNSNNRKRIIFGTIAQMADKLGIKVVVEGVETLENIQLMKDYGCTYAQGFYYARPMEAASFDAIYKEGKV